MRHRDEGWPAEVLFASRASPSIGDPVHAGRIGSNGLAYRFFVANRTGKEEIALQKVGNLLQPLRCKSRIGVFRVVSVGLVEPKRNNVFAFCGKPCVGPVDVVPQIYPRGLSILAGDAGLCIMKLEVKGNEGIVIFSLGGRKIFPKPREGFRVLVVVQAQQIFRLLFQMSKIWILR